MALHHVHVKFRCKAVGDKGGWTFVKKFYNMMSRQITQQSKTNISAPAGGKTVIFVSTYALKCSIFICKKEKKKCKKLLI